MTDINEPSRDREKLKNKSIATASNDEEHEHEHEEHDEDDAARVGGAGDSDNQTLQEMAPIRDRRGKTDKDTTVTGPCQKGGKKLTASAQRERSQKDAERSAQQGTQEEVQASAPEITQDEGQPSGAQGEGGVTRKPIAKKAPHLVPIELKKTDFGEEIRGLPRDGGAFLFEYKDSWAREIYETEYHSDAIRLLKPSAAPEKYLDYMFLSLWVMNVF